MTKKDKEDLIVSSIFALLFIILGFVMIFFGTKIHNKIKFLRKYGIRTHGIILRYERRKGTKINDYFMVPIIRFKTNSDEEITFEGKIDNTKFLSNICKSGKEVEVIYNPNNPNDAIVNSFASIWFFPLLLWIIGFGFIFFPPFTVWKYFHEKNLI